MNEMFVALAEYVLTNFLCSGIVFSSFCHQFMNRNLVPSINQHISYLCNKMIKMNIYLCFFSLMNGPVCLYLTKSERI